MEEVKEVSFSDFSRTIKDLFTEVLFKLILEFLERANIERLQKIYRI